MADDATRKTSTSKSTNAANTATIGEHDRVQLLSLRADGSHDQLNPELIGDREATLAATKEQFRQQAVSAVDVVERSTGPGEYADAPQDPYVEALQKKHQEAEKAAEAAAEKAVKDLLP